MTAPDFGPEGQHFLNIEGETVLGALCGVKAAAGAAEDVPATTRIEGVTCADCRRLYFGQAGADPFLQEGFPGESQPSRGRAHA